MKDTLFKLFGSVRLVQEVTRSSQSSTVSSPSPTLIDSDSSIDPSSSTTSIDSTTSSNNSTIDLIDTTTPNTPNTPNNEEETIEYIHSPALKQQHIPISLKTFTPSILSIYKPRDMRNLFHTPTTTRKKPKSIRQHRRQFERQKSKSQKLLCLWPLPTVTRYMILVACFISTLNCLNILDLSCSAPSYVIHRFDFKNLILSPFLFDWTLPSIVLFGWNVLILGLFEESLGHMVGGTRRFVELMVFLFTIVSSLRLLLGFLFSKSTGWALPILFFSNSMHECSQGLAPFLYALLVVQSLSIDDKYILIYGQDDSHKITVRKVNLQLAMCLINYTTRNILWWSISGLLTGFLATVLLQTLLAREKREDSSRVKYVDEFITLEKYRRTPMWRLIWSAIKKSALVVIMTLPILMAWNSYYTREFMVTATELNTISQDRYLFTFIFMTAPRRGDPDYLSRTIESYLAAWPEYPTIDSPYSRMQAIVYTHFSNHSQFDSVQLHFSKTTKGQRYLKWVKEDGGDLNQRLHVAKALDYVTETYQSTYYALMEDDFPVCGMREWHEIENVIYKAEKNVPSHCGVFVGTGGSGLFLKPELARLTSGLLLEYLDIPPDIIIQKCLMGELPECSGCVDSLVTSKTLLMYHIGYNTSTSEDRVYKKDEFQCGWRHPFNGDPSVITL